MWEFVEMRELMKQTLLVAIVVFIFDIFDIYIRYFCCFSQQIYDNVHKQTVDLVKVCSLRSISDSVTQLLCFFFT